MVVTTIDLRMAYPFTAFTIFSAPSLRLSAAITFRPDVLMISLPFSTLVPSRRTTSGTDRLVSFAAATTPLGVLISGPLLFGLGDALLGNLFAISAGLLLFVATGPLMAPLKDMSPGRGLLALSSGVGLAILLMTLPFAGHDHAHLGHDHSHAIETDDHQNHDHDDGHDHDHHETLGRSEG